MPRSDPGDRERVLRDEVAVRVGCGTVIGRRRPRAPGGRNLRYHDDEEPSREHEAQEHRHRAPAEPREPDRGGRSVLGLALAATLLAYVIGLAVGLTAGYSRSKVDPILMRTVDVMLAFPPLLFVLILISGAGTGVTVVVIAVAAIQAPSVSRVVRTATQVVAVRGYVEAAVARGESTFAVIRREVVPNILAPVLVDFGLRFTYSILIIASVNFLGLGLQPPSSDWALLISENRQYI